MKKFVVVLLVAMLVTPMAYAVETAVPEIGPDAAPAPAKQYFCPMDGYTSNKPGKCGKCGMDLIEMPAAATATADATVAGTT